MGSNKEGQDPAENGRRDRRDRIGSGYHRGEGGRGQRGMISSRQHQRIKVNCDDPLEMAPLI